MSERELTAVRALYAIIREHELDYKPLWKDRVEWGRSFPGLLAVVVGEPRNAEEHAEMGDAYLEGLGYRKESMTESDDIRELRLHAGQPPEDRRVVLRPTNQEPDIAAEIQESPQATEGDDGFQLRIRCDKCGHFLRFRSDHCPQCMVELGSSPEVPWTCRCDRCNRMEAAFKTSK